MTDCGNVTEIFNDSFISPYTSPEKPADLLLEPDAKFVLVQDDTSTCHGSQAVGMFGDSSQHSEPLLAESGFHDHEGAHVQNDDLPTANVYAGKNLYGKMYFVWCSAFFKKGGKSGQLTPFNGDTRFHTVLKVWKSIELLNRFSRP